MKKSSYILTHKMKDGKLFIYNAITRASITLDAELNLNNLDDLIGTDDECLLNTLKDNLILFDDDIDPQKLNQYILNKNKYDSGTLSIVDAVTFQCNLRCKYCMEQNRDSTFESKFMNVKDRIGIWKQLMVLTNSEDIKLTLFGGEPFFNISYIEDLLTESQKQGISIKYINVVTNGTICNDKLINLLNTYKFKSIQITLDGTPEIHDKRRINTNSEGTWEKIIENMDKILNKTKVDIIVNTVVDKNNFSVYEKMIDLLINKFTKYIFGDESRIIFNVGMACKPEGECLFTTDNVPSKVEYAELYSTCIQKAINKKVKINNFIPNPVCIYNKEYELIIAPDGDIYKCISGIGVDDFKVVSKQELFTKPELFLERLSTFIENNDKECLNCEFAMFCNGGCKFNRYVNGHKDCNKAYLKKFVGYFVKLISQVKEIDDNIFIKK